ncbi:MAG: peptide-methionine (R)-S-oxide reductase MsrB [Janthinobacterium lividum]
MDYTRRASAAAGATVVVATLLDRHGAGATTNAVFPVQHTDAEWRALLAPAAFEVLREQGTEAPWSSNLLHVSGPGRFICDGCAQPLFDAGTKFDSGTGWPSLWAPLPNAVQTRKDHSLLMSRTEVHCPTCGGHLGHVFDDVPQPTGLRYCMNGVAMTFTKA